MESGIKNLLRHFGTQVAVARVIDKKPQAVQKWQQVPSEHVIPLHKASGFVLRPFDLRPDLYPEPDWVLGQVERRNLNGIDQSEYVDGVELSAHG